VAAQVPQTELLATGDLLIPVADPAHGWTVNRLSPDSPHYPHWLAAHQRMRQPQRVGMDVAFCLFIPPLTPILAIIRFAASEVGPGLAVLMAGSIGVTLYWLGFVVFVGVHVAQSFH
jgi:hypothetical protein